MDFQESERAFLTANRAVLMGDDGIERYVGLTEKESVAYLDLSRTNDAGGLQGEAETHYRALHEKHETARQAYVRGEKSLHAFQKP